MKFRRSREDCPERVLRSGRGHEAECVAIMVFFGRKEKLEDRCLLASMDAMNGAIIHQIDNGKACLLSRGVISIRNIPSRRRQNTRNGFARNEQKWLPAKLSLQLPRN